MRERKPACWRKGMIFESEGQESERASGVRYEQRSADGPEFRTFKYVFYGEGGSRPQ